MPEVIDILSDDDDDVSTDSTQKANAADAREGTWKIILLMDHREFNQTDFLKTLADRINRHFKEKSPVDRLYPQYCERVTLPSADYMFVARKICNISGEVIDERVLNLIIERKNVNDLQQCLIAPSKKYKPLSFFEAQMYKLQQLSMISNKLFLMEGDEDSPTEFYQQGEKMEREKRLKRVKTLRMQIQNGEYQGITLECTKTKNDTVLYLIEQMEKFKNAFNPMQLPDLTMHGLNAQINEHMKDPTFVEYLRLRNIKGVGDKSAMKVIMNPELDWNKSFISPACTNKKTKSTLEDRATFYVPVSKRRLSAASSKCEDRASTTTPRKSQNASNTPKKKGGLPASTTPKRKDGLPDSTTPKKKDNLPTSNSKKRPKYTPAPETIYIRPPSAQRQQHAPNSNQSIAASSKIMERPSYMSTDPMRNVQNSVVASYLLNDKRHDHLLQNLLPKKNSPPKKKSSPPQRKTPASATAVAMVSRAPSSLSSLSSLSSSSSSKSSSPPPHPPSKTPPSIQTNRTKAVQECIDISDNTNETLQKKNLPPKKKSLPKKKSSPPQRKTPASAIAMVSRSPSLLLSSSSSLSLSSSSKSSSPPPHPPSKTPPSIRTTRTIAVQECIDISDDTEETKDNLSWVCKSCTFINDNMCFLLCELCNEERI